MLLVWECCGTRTVSSIKFHQSARSYSWQLISAYIAFVFISWYCGATFNPSNAAVAPLSDAWWVEVWCMVRGTAPAPLNTGAQSGGWESAWRWESWRCSFSLSSVRKQENRWPRGTTILLQQRLLWRHTRENIGEWCQGSHTSSVSTWVASIETALVIEVQCINNSSRAQLDGLCWIVKYNVLEKEILSALVFILKCYPKEQMFSNCRM